MTQSTLSRVYEWMNVTKTVNFHQRFHLLFSSGSKSHINWHTDGNAFRVQYLAWERIFINHRELTWQSSYMRMTCVPELPLIHGKIKLAVQVLSGEFAHLQCPDFLIQILDNKMQILSETETEAVQNNITLSETAFGHEKTNIINICNDCINIYNCRKVMPTLSSPLHKNAGKAFLK